MSQGLSSAAGVVLLDDAGRLSSATPAAARLPELVAAPEEIPAGLRALNARCALAGDDRPIVIGLPVRSGGRVILTLIPTTPKRARSSPAGRRRTRRG